jgi:hypothetical protein
LKSDEDRDDYRNKAKFRAGNRYFKVLTERLQENGLPWQYHFYFLSPSDFTDFFQQIIDKTYSGWQSQLMQQLDRL